MELYIQSSDLKKAEDFLQSFGKHAFKSVAMAMNQTITGVRTDANRAIRENYNVKASVINKTMTITRARPNPNRMYAVLESSGNPIPLINFGARPSIPTKRKPGVGVSVLVKKTGGRKVIPGSFVAQMKSGHIGIYTRTGQPKKRVSAGKYKGQMREPIKQLYSLSVPAMLQNNAVLEEIEARAIIRFEKNLNHAIDRFVMSIK